MTTPRHSTASAILSGNFDPEEIRRLVELGKERGLIKASASVSTKPKEKALRIVPKAAVPVPIESTGVVAADMAGVKSEWMEVDPGLAAHWLQNNFRNRRISEDTVRGYARDMVNGVWIATHQGIAFNDRAALIDGQQRLHAIILADVTIKMMVTTGLPSEIEGKEMTTMDAIDRGRPRSVADQLKLEHDLPNGSVIASVCASLGAICYGVRTRRMSVQQTLEIYRAFEEAAAWTIQNRPGSKGLRAAGVLAAFAFAMAAMDSRPRLAIADMFKRLPMAGSFDEGSPMAQLQEFLLSEAAALLNRGSDRGLAELTLHAIDLELRGATTPRLELSQEGVENFRRLQPERVARIVALFELPD